MRARLWIATLAPSATYEHTPPRRAPTLCSLAPICGPRVKRRTSPVPSGRGKSRSAKDLRQVHGRVELGLRARDVPRRGCRHPRWGSAPSTHRDQGKGVRRSPLGPWLRPEPQNLLGTRPCPRGEDNQMDAAVEAAPAPGRLTAWAHPASRRT